MYITD